MTLQEISKVIESVAPLESQESYDNAGLQCGDPQQEVSRVLACLDVTEEIVEEAKLRGCQLIVSHHPLLFNGVKCISPEAGYISRVMIEAIRNNIAIYAAHTNLDKAEGGTNYRLASILGLTNVKPMGDCGVWGEFEEPKEGMELLQLVGEKLDTRVRFNREALDADTLYFSMGICTGAGGDFIKEAELYGLDAYLTGEIRYHDFFGHEEMLLIEAGHFETEQFAPQIFVDILAKQCRGVECLAAESQVNPCPFL